MELQLNEYQLRKSKSERLGLMSLPLLVLGAVLAFSGTEGQQIGFYVGLFLLAFGIILMIVSLVRFNTVISDFKKTFLKDYFSKIIKDGDYRPKKGLDPLNVYECGFLKRADRFKSWDYLSGEIDGISFLSSDVHLQKRQVYTDSKGRRQTKYVTFFKGRLFRFDFNKNIDHDVQVLERYSPSDGKRYRKVKLESIDFNKKFKTYSTDTQTAFYVLTPHFMEALMKIENNHPGNLGFSFKGDHMFFAIYNNKSTFPIRPFVKIDEKLIDTFKADVELVYELVDDLKLNKNIFKEDK